MDVFLTLPDDAALLRALVDSGHVLSALLALDDVPPELAAALADRVAGAPRRDRPYLDDDGLLRFGGRWVSLPVVDRGLVRALLDRFGQVVSREALSGAGWPGEQISRNALDVHVLRLRRRLHPLGLEIRTIRAQGYLLQAAAGD